MQELDQSNIMNRKEEWVDQAIEKAKLEPNRAMEWVKANKPVAAMGCVCLLVLVFLGIELSRSKLEIRSKTRQLALERQHVESLTEDSLRAVRTIRAIKKSLAVAEAQNEKDKKTITELNTKLEQAKGRLSKAKTSLKRARSRIVVLEKDLADEAFARQYADSVAQARANTIRSQKQLIQAVVKPGKQAIIDLDRLKHRYSFHVAVLYASHPLGNIQADFVKQVKPWTSYPSASETDYIWGPSGKRLRKVSKKLGVDAHYLYEFMKAKKIHANQIKKGNAKKLLREFLESGEFSYLATNIYKCNADFTDTVERKFLAEL